MMDTYVPSPSFSLPSSLTLCPSYNLGWKLASVLRGNASPSILSTYQSERHQTAKELIELDWKLSRMFSSKPREEGETVSASPSLFYVRVLTRRRR